MTVALKRMTVAEYLAWAEAQPESTRTELVGGEIVAMAAERNVHNLVKQQMWLALRDAVRDAGLPCTVLGDGATVVIDERTAYEPDALVQCGVPVDLLSLTADAPTIVVEVISPTSRGVDTNHKLRGYMGLPSVRHYLVVDAAARTVLHHAKGADGGLETRSVAGGRLRLDPPGLALDVAAAFEGL